MNTVYPPTLATILWWQCLDYFKGDKYKFHIHLVLRNITSGGYLAYNVSQVASLKNIMSVVTYNNEAPMVRGLAADYS